MNWRAAVETAGRQPQYSNYQSHTLLARAHISRRHCQTGWMWRRWIDTLWKPALIVLFIFRSKSLQLLSLHFKDPLLSFSFFLSNKCHVKHWQWSIKYDSISYIDPISPNNLSASHYTRPTLKSLPKALYLTPERYSMSLVFLDQLLVWQPVDNCIIVL